VVTGEPEPHSVASPSSPALPPTTLWLGCEPTTATRPSRPTSRNNSSRPSTR